MVTQMVRQAYFEKNREELDRQLRGDHGPQQQLQRVIFTLPEQGRIADLVGQLNEDLPESEIVRRKVATINAWLEYAWKTEPREPKPRQNHIKTRPSSTEVIRQAHAPQTLGVLEQGRAIAAKPWYASMVQDAADPQAQIIQDARARDSNVGSNDEVSEAAHKTTRQRNQSLRQTLPDSEATSTRDGKVDPNTPQIQIPSPPHIVLSEAVAPSQDGITGPVSETVIKGKHECSFCGKQFTRKGTMWNCADRHLRERTAESVPCPHPDCKYRGVVLENEARFKNHAIAEHGCELRPRVIPPTGAVYVSRIILQTGLTPCPNLKPARRLSFGQEKMHGL